MDSWLIGSVALNVALVCVLVAQRRVIEAVSAEVKRLYGEVARHWMRG